MVVFGFSKIQNQTLPPPNQTQTCKGLIYCILCDSLKLGTSGVGLWLPLLKKMNKLWLASGRSVGVAVVWPS